MPLKKKKYNARFPAGRIKKIMQSDEEVGKVAQAVPVIISRTLELFVESLLRKTLRITNSRNAKTLSPSHMKQCIMAENRFDFLRELVKSIPDISVSDEIGHEGSSTPGTTLESPPQREPYDLSKPSTSCEINFRSILNANGNSWFSNGSNTQSIGNAMKSSTVSSSTLLPSREDLKKQWETVGQIRQQILSTIPSAIGISSPLSHPAINFNNSNKHKKKFSTITNEDYNPAKLKRLDTLAGSSVHAEEYLENKSPCRKLEEISLPAKQVTSYQKFNSMPIPIVSIDMNEKNIIKLDYSNSNLHKYQAADFSTSNDIKKKTNDSLCFGNSNDSVDKKSMETVNPIINIDLSKIASQPPTIHVNLGKQIASTTEINISSSKTTTKMNSATVRSSSLELDEDYDNI